MLVQPARRLVGASNGRAVKAAASSYGRRRLVGASNGRAVKAAATSYGRRRLVGALADYEGECRRDDDQRGHDACEQPHGRSFDGAPGGPPRGT
jgi:hypothetical protein